ncbi:sulfide/dihydroorotate dehydrogenase-like FAD/NAD-binding protein [Spirochaeta africana]|uniref:2-polyprenylphenol hydroxylase-like oxidoreductase n=1 Tax=Spirochaeta africana (strain ATCC 700263 / DSM 8902 / Z-7692) TaxID=889378 RepID=H9UMV5_SPIAZ|nr:sulfide/dihydroorotate dehydrogenase-like FAD/NAD-binding protein [Spirochaeta africana]AFG38848.1 2-polyprenylphenol hydroxylase-like oxidoreductase [Spirochaeta africana DSM 8902]
MYHILHKEQLAEKVFLMKIQAPLIAQERRAGQFVIIQPDTDFGERIPLTIADADVTAGTITLIFQAVGKTTTDLSAMQTGDPVANVLGPLGNPTHIANFGHVVCVAGGIGAAPMFPIAQALKQAGNSLTLIIGARSRELVILEERMRSIADNLIICTDDGSYGRKALVTEPLEELCSGADKPDKVFAIGPPVMMKFCAATTKPYQVPTMVSLNTIMVDGTGMCGGCRVTVNGETRFTCVDGPEFDGHQVDFENMLARLGSYRPQEQDALHKCRISV